MFVDEVPNDPKNDHWVHLLKNQWTKFVTIGAGVPLLDSESPSFSMKLPATRMLLTDDNLTDDFVEQLAQEFQVNNRTSIRKVLVGLLDFTGGHMFPLITLAQYFLSEHKEKCELGTIDALSFVKSGSFSNLPVVGKITRRCVDISYAVIDYCSDIFTMDKSMDDPLRQAAVQVLVQKGYFMEETNRFVSEMFVMLLFKAIGTRETRSFSIDFSSPSAIYHIALSALNQMRKGHFFSGDKQRNEQAIGFFVGQAMAYIHGVFVFPHYPIKLDKPASHPPNVDFYIDGKVNTFVTLTINGSQLESHSVVSSQVVTTLGRWLR